MSANTHDENLERALRDSLPVVLHPHVPALVALLADVIAGKLTPHEADQRLATDPQFVSVARALAGHTLVSSAYMLHFGTSDPASASSHPATVTLHVVHTGGGDYAAGNIDKRRGVFVDLHVHAGDPPDVRQQKIRRMRRLIIDEILANITSLDARLGFVAVIQNVDPTEQRLAALRATIAPATAPIAAAGYRRLMAAQHTAALRQAFNSRPLAMEPGSILVDLWIESGANADGLRFFYAQLAQSQDAGESLLALLTEVAGRETTDVQIATYDDQRIDLAVRVVRNRAHTAHIAGLRVLSILEAEDSIVQTALAPLNYLEPRQLADAATTTRLLSDYLGEAGVLMEERAALLVQARQVLDQALDAYAQLETLLTIQPSDPWHVVVGKARSLRDLGRTADAVAAFSRYADMFGPTDPTARAYARTAQQFTLQCAALGLTGGIYLYELAPDGAAAKAELIVGDIVIGYGERMIVAMPDLVAALQESDVGMLIRVAYLRLDAQGHFAHRITTMTGGPPGAGFLPV